MSANELEDLMSQLHVDSQLNMHVDNLGIKPNENGEMRWSYDEEKTHTRDGRERHPHLSDDQLNRKIEHTYIYDPKFGDFLYDFDDKRINKPKLPKQNGIVQWNEIESSIVWKALFFNEHYQKQRFKKKYYRLRNGNVQQQSGSAQVTSGGAGGNGGANGNSATQKQTYAQTARNGAQVPTGGGSKPSGPPANRNTTKANVPPASQPSRNSGPSEAEKNYRERQDSQQKAFTSRDKNGKASNFLRDPSREGRS
jgi:hypothetical protein